MMNINRQNFNYHIHTLRCGHANGSEEEYVIEAIKCGMKKIAFTDHIPLPNNNFPNSRMDMDEIEDYLSTINYLKIKYKGLIEIESGFEFEYYEKAKQHFLEVRKKVDKMILGQHFVIDEDGKETRIFRTEGRQINDDVLELYVKTMERAINLGLVDIIAHPDLFMQARDDFGQLEEEVTRRICWLAVENNIPLEINMGKINTALHDKKTSRKNLLKNIPYPSRAFWRIISEESQKAIKVGKQLKVLYGKDAHCTEDLSSEICYQVSDVILGEEILRKLYFVNADLVINRHEKDEEEI